MAENTSEDNGDMKPLSKRMSSLLGLKAVVLLLLLLPLLNLGVANAQFGYSSAFEGPKATFYGIKDGNTGLIYTNEQKNGANMATFNTVLRFDPDAAREGKPNLIGEMTTVFLPDKSASNMILPWIPSSWIAQNNYIINPQREILWNISDYTYIMKQYLCRFYVSINCEWDGDGGKEAPDLGSNYFTNQEVWIKLDIEPTWYIDGQNMAYFAVAQIRLADQVVYGGLTLDGNQGWTRTQDGGVSVSPESIQTPVFIFDNAFGGENYEEKQAEEYQGRKLNPAYFKDEAYICLNLERFGTWSEAVFGIPPWNHKGDVATWKFDVVVFLFGEWNVQDVQEDPDIYGRFQRASLGVDFLDIFLDNLWWIIPVAAIVLLVMYAPWVLMAIIGLIGGRRR